MRLIFLTFFSVLILNISVYAQIDKQHSAKIYNKKPNYFIGFNPVAGLATFQLQEDFKRFIPQFSGVEYGYSIVAGYFLKEHQTLEARFSLGDVHHISRVGQLHLGTNYFILHKNEKWYRRFYTGGFIKYWDYHNKLTDVHFYNIAPYITFGYMFNFNPVLLDLRLNQTFAIYSWSSLKRSSAGYDWFFSPWPDYIPVMPSFSITVSWKF